MFECDLCGEVDCNCDGKMDANMMRDLNMKCGDCPIIDYCNGYGDTPPCSQPRFEDLKVSDFKNVCDYLENRSLWEDED